MGFHISGCARQSLRYAVILLALLFVCTAHAEDRDTAYWEEYRCTVEDMEQRGMECEKRTIRCDHGYLDSIHYFSDSIVFVAYQRRLARWTFKVVDTNYLCPGGFLLLHDYTQTPDKFICIKEDPPTYIYSTIPKDTLYDTTWIPLAVIFIDTSGANDE